MLSHSRSNNIGGRNQSLDGIQMSVEETEDLSEDMDVDLSGREQVNHTPPIGPGSTGSNAEEGLDTFPLKKLTLLGRRKIAGLLDGHSPVGNWENLARKLSLSDWDVAAISRGYSVEYTPAYELIHRVLPQAFPGLTIGDIIKQLDGPLHQRLTASQVREACQEQKVAPSTELGSAPRDIKILLANALSLNIPLVGNYEDLAESYGLKMSTIRELKTRARRQERHSPTLYLFDLIMDNGITLEELAIHLSDMDRNDVSYLIQTMILNPAKYREVAE